MASIDLLDYMRGTPGRIHTLDLTFNDYDQHLTTVIDGAVFRQVKGNLASPTGTAEYEQMSYDASFIYRKWDISPGKDKDTGIQEVYAFDDNDAIFGVAWIPRYPTIDEMWFVDGITTFYEMDHAWKIAKTGDGRIKQYPFPHWIQYKGRTKNKRLNGIVLDYVELWGWYEPTPGKRVKFEEYGYAKGYGLVYWKNTLADNVQSMIKQEQFPGNLSYRIIPWIENDIPKIDEPEDITYPTLDTDEDGWEKRIMFRPDGVTGRVNIRQLPTTQSSIIGTFSAERNVFKHKRKTELIKGERWHAIKFSDDLGATHDEDKTTAERPTPFNKTGWVHGGFAEFRQVPLVEPDPVPDSDETIYYKIPMPEARIPDDVKQILLHFVGLGAKLLTTVYPKTPSRDTAERFILWIGDLFRDWDKAKEEADAIIIVEQDVA